MPRNLDELVTTTEHAKPVHPVHELLSHHFYLDGLVNTEGGLWIALINALLFVPLVMAAFFYPVEVLVGTGVALLAAFAVYAVWKRRRVRA